MRRAPILPRVHPGGRSKAKMMGGLHENWPHTAHSMKMSRVKRRGRRETWTQEEKDKLKRLWDAGAPIEELCEELERKDTAIYSKAAGMGLPRRSERGKRGNFRKRRIWERDSGNQRRFHGVKPGTGSKITLAEHDPRARAGITVFPTTVIPASQMGRLLKSGHNSRKIGKQFDRGHWKGMPISTLTLQERDTCPRTCAAWTFCYGNNMPFAQRIQDDGTLERRLWGELAALAAENPAGFAVRLHVLGDFFSVSYVDFWRERLAEFPSLHIFGFTARRPNDPIGAALIFLVRDEPLRFRMRFSGGGYETDCSEIVGAKEEAKGIVCPAELDADRSCATCGICPSSNKTIHFIKH